MSSVASRTLLAVVVLCAGCLPSLNAVYTPEDLVFEPDIVGMWQQEKSPATWEFSRGDGKSYDLVFTDKSGLSGNFVAHLAKLDDMLLLDIYPGKDLVDSPAFYKYHLVPFHTVYLVEKTSPQLTLVSVDLKWLGEYLNENPDALEHTNLKNRKLITAPTEELQKFLQDHRDQFTGRFNLVPFGEQEI